MLLLHFRHLIFLPGLIKESDPESGSLVGTQQPVFTLKLSVSF